MSGISNIEWTDATWNPVTGCSHVSEGCRNCYAESITARFRKDHKPWTAQNAAHNVILHPERLEDPLHWRKPRRVFVNSMSDLFHEHIETLFIGRVLNVIGKAKQHTFQVLTKRPSHMLNVMIAYYDVLGIEKPYENLWLGVSCEDQKTADERIPLLLDTPAAVRFVSYEPALGPVDFMRFMKTWQFNHEGELGLNWIIAGGESGRTARPCHVDWLRSAVEQCKQADVPIFVKQVGSNPEWFESECWETYGPPDDPKGGDPEEWAEDLRVRKFPR